MTTPPGAPPIDDYTPRAAVATMPDTIADIDYAPTKTPICGPGFTIRDLRAELRTARARIADLEAREAALVAALDEALDIANHATDVIETECDDPDGNCEVVRATLDRLRAIAHPPAKP